MNTKETAAWVQRERVGRDLMNALQIADQDMNDSEIARIVAKLEALGYAVEWTSAGYMVSR